jgi:hypothetical protein
MKNEEVEKKTLIENSAKLELVDENMLLLIGIQKS